MKGINSSQRLREFFYYPKLSEEEDHLHRPSDFASFLQYPDERGQVDTFIYIHIPFCDYLCHFCPFYKTLNQTTPEETREAFVSALVNEIQMYAASPRMVGRKIHWIEFGGGTPTSLSTDQLQRILRGLRDSFDLSECEFVTMEGDALTLQEEEKLAALVDRGVNRVSYGVQTFKEPLRRKLGLKPTIDDLYRAADSIRRAGVAEFAVDLLYNLPDQSIDELQADIETIFSLRSDYIDSYPLTLWDNSRFSHQVESGRYGTIPRTEDSLPMFRLIQRETAERGYSAEHSYTFTRGPRRYIDNVKQNILRDGDMLGLGPSARGHIGDRQYMNVASLESYIDAIQARGLPMSVGMHVSPEERAHRLMVMFPSLLLSIDESDVPDFERFEPAIVQLDSDGLLRRAGRRIEMTEAGLGWAGNMSRLFFSPPQKAKMTRSHLYSLRHHVNPYNQDTTGVPKRALVRSRSRAEHG